MFKKYLSKILLIFVFFISFFGRNVSYADGTTVYLNAIVESPYKLPINIEVYNHETGDLVDTYVLTKEDKWVKEVYLSKGKYDFNAFLDIEEGISRREKLRYFEYTREVSDKPLTVDFMEGSDDFINRLQNKLLGVETPSGTPYFTGETTILKGKEIANELAMSQTGDSPQNEGYVEPSIDGRYDHYEQRKDNVFNGEFFESPTGEGKNFHEKNLDNGDVNNLADDIKSTGESIKSEDNDEAPTNKKEKDKKIDDVKVKKKNNKKERKIGFIPKLLFVLSIVGLLVFILKRKRII